MFVSYSCSKNFGLYRDRVGAISIVSRAADLAVIDGQAQNIVRTMYSMPPDHGSAAVTLVLTSPELHAEWQDELTDMRNRMQDMRKLLADALSQSARNFDASPIRRAKGMFCFLGVSPEQVTRLKQEFGIYLVDSGRINVCGISKDNADYVAESVAALGGN
jgi:aspartate/tyrosine/aromatic aminotransferase